MPGLLSAYFDIVRVGAALVVLFSHAWIVFFPKHPLPWPGHQAVILFFVLSGYVIAFVSDTKEKTLGDFILSRAARILSVTVPALILTFFVTVIINENWRPEVYKIALNSVFLGQNWMMDAMIHENMPYWSLCYEVWYYTIFAGFVFARPFGLKLGIAGTFAILAGPKILLLMPSWLMGVALYRYRNCLKMAALPAVGLIAFSAVAYAIYFWFDVGIAIRETMRQFWPHFIENIDSSNHFVGDAILGIIVSINFAGIAALAAHQSKVPPIIARTGSQIAAFTLSIYLYHYPIVLLAQHFRVVGLPGIALAIAAPMGLAIITELRRSQIRAFLRRTFRTAKTLETPLPERATL